MNKKKALKLMIVVLGLILFVSFQNNWIGVSNITYKNIKIPNAFNQKKILHISDLHNKEFGNNNDRLISKIKKAEIDFVVITGDLIDSSTKDISSVIGFAETVQQLAPTYYVSGNHEVYSGQYDAVIDALTAVGVNVLDNIQSNIEIDGQWINIYGLSDSTHPNFNIKDNLKQINENEFNILLSHRPELLPYYAETKVDLVFSGHAHGGQFRLPFVGGLIAPNQGLLPKLTQGTHTLDDTTLVISRGLGNSIIPIRVFNRPELIIVTLTNE